jgi:hypothetical protein
MGLHPSELQNHTTNKLAGHPKRGNYQKGDISAKGKGTQPKIIIYPIYLPNHTYKIPLHITTVLSKSKH